MRFNLLGTAFTGYGPNGEKLVAGVVPLSKDKTQVLLVQSPKGNWVFPKGGWETDEATPEVAACREAWEEAGVVCTIISPLGQVVTQSKRNNMAKYHFFEAIVEREESQWPEMNRGRKWVSLSQAEKELFGRPELLFALQGCIHQSSAVRGSSSASTDTSSASASDA